MTDFNPPVFTNTPPDTPLSRPVSSAMEAQLASEVVKVQPGSLGQANVGLTDKGMQVGFGLQKKLLGVNSSVGGWAGREWGGRGWSYGVNAGFSF